MDQILSLGANCSLGAFEGVVMVSHDDDSAIDVNLTAFLLDSLGKANGDEGIVFYNQPIGPNKVAEFLPPQLINGKKQHQLRFNLAKAPEGISKIAITLTEDNQRGFSHVNNLQAEIITAQGKIQLSPSSFSTERGVIALELYLRNNEAKARSVWQGFSSGLAGLCELYGIEVAAEAPADTPPPAPKIELEKKHGKLDLSKSQKKVLIEKTPEIIASISWKSGTDYDVYALVMTKSGQQIDVCTFGAEGVEPLTNYGNGKVQHMGDVKASGGSKIKQEIIKIRLTDDILAVVPVAYSAQSNGTGSFYKYKVSMQIDNQKGTAVSIDAANASNNKNIYTCIPGIIYNTDDGVQIEYLELYSAVHSENRPKLCLKDNNQVSILMDEGPINDYK